jgi:hypothetical protein
MSTIVIESELQKLRPGDRVRYHRVDWNIEDHSRYQDPQGYQTEEWLLKSKGGSEYYLLREFDPSKTPNSATWYLAEQVEDPRLLLPDSQENIVPRLWQQMRSQAKPYPELQLFYKIYYFESQSQGSYQSEGKTQSRNTWDYWDNEHKVNLAIEAFPHGQLDIYLTKLVQPEEFSQIQKGISQSQIKNSTNASFILQLVVALCMIFVGIMLMIFG